MDDFMSLVKFLLVPLIDMINTLVPNTYVRFWVSVVVCMIFGTIIDYAIGGFTNVNDWATAVLATFGFVQLIYGGFYKGSDAQNIIRIGSVPDSTVDKK